MDSLNSWESTKITSLDKVKSGEWLILAQLGDNPITELPAANVPTIPQIAKTEEQRQLLRFGAAAPNQFGKVYVVPSAVPQDRSAALEAALTKTFAERSSWRTRKRENLKSPRYPRSRCKSW